MVSKYVVNKAVDPNEDITMTLLKFLIQGITPKLSPSKDYR